MMSSSLTLTRSVCTKPASAGPELLERVFETRPRSAEMTVFCVEAPLAPLEHLLEPFPEERFCLWGAPDGSGAIGIGAVEAFIQSGTDRLVDLQSWCQRVSSQVLVQSLVAGACPSPRLLGGVSFAPGSCRGAPWQEFHDAYFCLPRWTYVREAERAYLYLAARESELDDASTRVTWLDEYSAILEALESSERKSRLSTPLIAARRGRPEPIEQLPFERWREQIDGVHALIRSGCAHKIVVARRARVSLSRARNPARVLATMRDSKSNCTRFGVRMGESTFLGLTPELLFRKSGSLFATHALAGTARQHGPAAHGGTPGQELLNSAKDAAEHAFVVDEIRARMRPLCSTLIADERPRLRQARKLVHLETHFAGTLSGRTHAAKLLSVLHPTPAVAGTPTQAAVDWVAAHEAAARGWYAGAVGYMDLAGDGAFCVAIRSGLLTERHAYAFSGAGIVESSDALSEYCETAAKQEAFLSALGLTETEAMVARESGLLWPS